MDDVNSTTRVPPPPPPRIIKLDCHRHPLKVEDASSSGSGNSEKCFICEGTIVNNTNTNSINYPFFRCVETECNVSLHVHCIPVLPRTVGYKYDEHPLILAQSPVYEKWLDYKDGKVYYCDYCEEERRLDDCCYSSLKCSRVFHVHCVLDQVIASLEKESEKRELVSNEKVVELAMKKLDELEIMMATLRTKIKGGTTKLEALKNKLKTLEYKRDNKPL